MNFAPETAPIGKKIDPEREAYMDSLPPVKFMQETIAEARKGISNEVHATQSWLSRFRTPLTALYTYLHLEDHQDELSHVLGVAKVAVAKERLRALMDEVEGLKMKYHHEQAIPRDIEEHLMEQIDILRD